jgi:hypothetical protein
MDIQEMAVFMKLIDQYRKLSTIAREHGFASMHILGGWYFEVSHLGGWDKVVITRWGKTSRLPLYMDYLKSNEDTYFGEWTRFNGRYL